MVFSHKVVNECRLKEDFFFRRVWWKLESEACEYMGEDHFQQQQCDVCRFEVGFCFVCFPYRKASDPREGWSRKMRLALDKSAHLGPFWLQFDFYSSHGGKPLESFKDSFNCCAENRPWGCKKACKGTSWNQHPAPRKIGRWLSWGSDYQSSKQSYWEGI